ASSICTSTTSQLGAIKAAELYPALHAQQMGALEAFRQSALAACRAKVLPGAALSILAVQPSDIMAAPTLRQHGFDFADGAAFGAPGVLRLAIVPDNCTADALALFQ
ncbi:MAG: hypothetical protein GX605_07615, partial [Chloroflexi bacterium]|nr:hypothetical protein [Chloroflexota bacterium]